MGQNNTAAPVWAQLFLPVKEEPMNRYSVIHGKNPREILLLRGSGCRWKRCRFCDYHLDSAADAAENLRINLAAMAKVTGICRHLEVINSGSFPELDGGTMAALKALCREKGIETLHFECHFLWRKEIPRLREEFAAVGTALKIKTGVETFDCDFRERVLCKGIAEREPAKIAAGFDECCLLFGLAGQTEESMRRDIETGLSHFERVCVNIFVENSTSVKPDPAVIACFRERIYPDYIENERVDILMNNTDFGVGGEEGNDAQ